MKHVITIHNIFFVYKTVKISNYRPQLEMYVSLNSNEYLRGSVSTGCGWLPVCEESTIKWNAKSELSNVDLQLCSSEWLKSKLHEGGNVTSRGWQ